MDDHQELIEQMVRSVLWTDVPDALLLVNRGDILAANPSAVDLLGYEKAVLERMMVEDLVPQGITDAHRRWRNEFGSVGGRRVMRPESSFPARRADGSIISVNIGLTPAIGSDDLLLAVLRAHPGVLSFVQQESVLQHLFAAGLALRQSALSGRADAKAVNETLDLLDHIIGELAQPPASPSSGTTPAPTNHERLDDDGRE